MASKHLPPVSEPDRLVTDEEAVNAWREADPAHVENAAAAWRPIEARIGEVIKMIARKYTGSPEDAEDLCTMIYIHVLDGLQKGKWAPTGPLTAWVADVAQNAGKDWYRSKRAKKRDERVTVSIESSRETSGSKPKERSASMVLDVEAAYDLVESAYDLTVCLRSAPTRLGEERAMRALPVVKHVLDTGKVEKLGGLSKYKAKQALDEVFWPIKAEAIRHGWTPRAKRREQTPEQTKENPRRGPAIEPQRTPEWHTVVLPQHDGRLAGWLDGLRALPEHERRLVEAELIGALKEWAARPKPS